MIKHVLTTLLVCAAPAFASGQVILNPSFENTSAAPCTFNVSNTLFNAVMPYVTAYGSYENCDLISNSCGFGTAYDGIWFIGLSVPPAANVFDAIALELSSPLTVGQSYLLSFYQKKDAGYDANDIEIGYSTVDTIQGTVAATLPAPVSTTWVQYSAILTPSLSASYITLSVVPAKYGWNHIDSLSLANITALMDFSGNRHLKVFPNPASDIICVSGAFAGPPSLAIELRSIRGEPIALFYEGPGVESICFPVGNFKRGVYLLYIRSAEISLTRKMVLL